MLLMHIVGARPNFMKAAPVLAAVEKCLGFTQLLIHTGQHYDDNMSQVFFRDLGLPMPDVNLGVGSGSHSVQTAEIMVRIERVLLEHKPGIVLVYGDVNSTVAAALVAVKLGITVAHVEAGLRSFDRSMPEEINRIVTDRIADMLFTPSEDGDENLLREGVSPDRIFRVGNVMIDTLVRLENKAEERWPLLPRTLGFQTQSCGKRTTQWSRCTVPRTWTNRLASPLVETLAGISRHLPVIFPVHPRTRERLRAAGIDVDRREAVRRLVPRATSISGLAATGGPRDHGLGRNPGRDDIPGSPCLPCATNTERPVTTSLGTNRLIGSDVESLELHVKRILDGDRPAGKRPPLWDGQAGERIAAVLATHSPSPAGDATNA